jgi:D-alanine-D-alanine ligase-like ATP-grasp enzyme
MIQFKLLSHYLGASPYAPWPTLIIGIRMERALLKRIFDHRRRVLDLLNELPDGVLLIKTLRQQPEHDHPMGETWILSWIDAMQKRSGDLRLESPVWLDPFSDHPKGPVIMKVRIDHFSSDCSAPIGWLQWSAKLWHWPSGQADHAHLRSLISSAPKPAKPHKASFIAMAAALARMGVNWHYDNLGSPLLVVGSGVAGQRLSQKLTERTSGWGMNCARNKFFAKRLLEQVGLPIAGGRVVTSLSEALEVAERLGYPVVTKPVAADQGDGVVTQIDGRDALQRAYPLSESGGVPVLVEKQIVGKDYRFYLVKGQLKAALERIPGGVVGDGKSTIRQLVKQLNDSRKKHRIEVEGGQAISLNSLKWNDELQELLRLSGLEEASIPAQDHYVRLRYSANFSVGGTVRECLDEVHPLNRAMVEKIARLFALDLAGVDVIAPTMETPIFSNGGVICEVNGMPGVLPHMLAQPHRKLMEETAGLLIGPQAIRPPLIAVHGQGSTELIAGLEEELHSAYPRITVATREGRRQGGEWWAREDTRTFAGHRVALQDPLADAFLIELDEAVLIKYGLAWSRTDVLILLDGDGVVLPPAWERWLVMCSETTLISPQRHRAFLAVGEALEGMICCEMTLSQVADAIRTHMLQVDPLAEVASLTRTCPKGSTSPEQPSAA